VQSGGGPISEADMAAALEAVGGRSYAAEIAQWVHSTDELPLADLLRAHGVAALEDPSQPAQALGLRVAEANGSVQVKVVLRGGAAEKAGFSAHDEWIGIEVPAAGKKGQQRPAQAWRIAKLEDLALYLGDTSRFTALVARDRKLLRLPLVRPEGSTTWRLFLHDAARVTAWLAPSARR
jgi:hypothetical protein